MVGEGLVEVVVGVEVDADDEEGIWIGVGMGLAALLLVIAPPPPAAVPPPGIAALVVADEGNKPPPRVGLTDESLLGSGLSLLLIFLTRSSPPSSLSLSRSFVPTDAAANVDMIFGLPFPIVGGITEDAFITPLRLRHSCYCLAYKAPLRISSLWSRGQSLVLVLAVFTTDERASGGVRELRLDEWCGRGG